MNAALVLATRRSPLAVRQAELVRDHLADATADVPIDLLPMSTSGDRRLRWSLEKKGGKGLFTRELEEALLDGRADLAVHSAKDLPTACDPALAIAGYLPRARANDVLVRSAERAQPESIATDSPRRRAQLAQLFPEAEWTTLRGNVGTRLRKIAEGRADATVLAAAGLDRLGIGSHEALTFQELTMKQVVPAPGQAAIAVQCRAQDTDRFRPHLCSETFLAVSLERAFLRRLGGGCQTPVGAHFADGRLLLFHPRTGHLDLELAVASPDEIDAALDDVFAAHNFEET